MALIYVWFLIVCFASAKFNKDLIPEMFEYLVRLGFFALMFIALYNTWLNGFRNLSWDHTGKNDFISTSDAFVVMIWAVGMAVVYEMGGLNFIRFWS